MKKNQNEEEFIEINPLKILKNEGNSEKWISLVKNKEKFTLEKNSLNKMKLSEIKEVKLYDLK